MRQIVREAVNKGSMREWLINRLWALLVFHIICVSISFAQSLSVESFRTMSLDLTSRTAPVKDNNNIPCALIKIICNDEVTGVQGSVVKTEEYGNEYWVYLTSGTKHIKILTQHHKPLEFSIIEYVSSGAVSQSTYQLELKSDLPPEVLYGASNPLAPIAMAKDGEPLLPKWWNTHEDGMYVGISLPTLDGETAKISAITNAVYSFTHSSGCFIRYSANIFMSESEENMQTISQGLNKGFSIKIAQEYYNSKGEYFVLCAINSDGKSSNTMMIDWNFIDENKTGTLSVNLAVQAKINRIPLRSLVQYEVSWTDISQQFSLTCNDKDLLHNKQIEVNDHISDFLLHEDLGFAQLRLLTAIPLLTDTISFTSVSSIWDDSYSSSTRILTEGKSIPVKINLTDSDLKGSSFSITERFPVIPFKNNTDNITGLSEKYYREYVDTNGNSTAFKSDGFCNNRLFEASKNKALLYALSNGISSMFSEMKSSFNVEKESIDSLRSDINSYSGLTTCKALIYPLYYLDSNERVPCKDKKYRKYWEKAKQNYRNIVSVLIPIEHFEKLNNLK